MAHALLAICLEPGSLMIMQLTLCCSMCLPDACVCAMSQHRRPSRSGWTLRSETRAMVPAWRPTRSISMLLCDLPAPDLGKPAADKARSISSTCMQSMTFKVLTLFSAGLMQSGPLPPGISGVAALNPTMATMMSGNPMMAGMVGGQLMGNASGAPFQEGWLKLRGIPFNVAKADIIRFFVVGHVHHTFLGVQACHYPGGELLTASACLW